MGALDSIGGIPGLLSLIFGVPSAFELENRQRGSVSEGLRQQSEIGSAFQNLIMGRPDVQDGRVRVVSPDGRESVLHNPTPEAVAQLESSGFTVERTGGVVPQLQEASQTFIEGISQVPERFAETAGKTIEEFKTTGAGIREDLKSSFGKALSTVGQLGASERQQIREQFQRERSRAQQSAIGLRGTTAFPGITAGIAGREALARQSLFEKEARERAGLEVQRGTTLAGFEQGQQSSLANLELGSASQLAGLQSGALTAAFGAAQVPTNAMTQLELARLGFLERTSFPPVVTPGGINAGSMFASVIQPPQPEPPNTVLPSFIESAGNILSAGTLGFFFGGRGGGGGD